MDDPGDYNPEALTPLDAIFFCLLIVIFGIPTIFQDLYWRLMKSPQRLALWEAIRGTLESLARRKSR